MGLSSGLKLSFLKKNQNIQVFHHQYYPLRPKLHASYSLEAGAVFVFVFYLQFQYIVIVTLYLDSCILCLSALHVAINLK